MTNAISVEGVSKRFRIYKNRNQSLKGAFLQRSRAQFEEFWALDDVSFEIPQGKTFGLLGHNGSGKSTLLKCIAKILTPDRGTISSTGRMAAMLEVGSGFHPELSGRENIYLNGAILGMSKKEIDSKLDAIIDFSGVERFIDQPVKNYSSGMYVRLGFSVSIHVEPPGWTTARSSTWALPPRSLIPTPTSLTTRSRSRVEARDSAAARP